MPVVDCLSNKNVSQIPPSSALMCIQVPSTMESLNRMLSNILNGSGMSFIGSRLLSSKVFLSLNFDRGKLKSFSCALIHFDISIEQALLLILLCQSIHFCSILLFFLFLLLSGTINQIVFSVLLECQDRYLHKDFFF